MKYFARIRRDLVEYVEIEADDEDEAIKLALKKSNRIGERYKLSAKLIISEPLFLTLFDENQKFILDDDLDK